MDTLSKLCDDHTRTSWVDGTDKGSEHSYIPVYERLFEPIRKDPIKILEIGIMSGHSILMWEEYFPNGSVYGVDINPIPALVQGRPRVQCYQHNSTDPGLLTKLGDTMFDIIIDDGCHNLGPQLATAELLFPRVKPGGLYFVEDVKNGNETAFTSVYKNVEVSGSRIGRDILIVIRKSK